jgi:pimeloyl-ACP methyl ester carboxylesterase
MQLGCTQLPPSTSWVARKGRSLAIATVNGANIWYEISGSGPLLVQIGGAVSAHEGYAAITPAMAEHFTVLDYDHRGYGLSERRPGQQYVLDV